MQPDTNQISIDTAAFESSTVFISDSVSEEIPMPETIVEQPPQRKNEIAQPAVETIKQETIIRAKDSIDAATPDIPDQAFKPIELYPHLAGKDSTVVSLSSNRLNLFSSEQTNSNFELKTRNSRRIFEKEWVFGVLLFTVALFVFVRIFYHKYLSSIVTSLVNIQLSEKLLREKSVLVRRVFFLLDAAYILALGLYAYKLTKHFNIDIGIANDFTLFLALVGVLTALITFRQLIVRVIAIIFDSVAVFREYNHNSFIVNKNLGIYLLPILISSFYTPEIISAYLFSLATILVLISLLVRYFKGIQIILKYNIFLFYSILYLCTLEILPVLIGIKFVLTQR